MKNKTILIVDDEPNILLSIRFLLERAGYHVLEASEGKTALEIARKQQPDVAILDVMMPGMNGFELAQQLRAIESLAQLRIVFLTARGTPQDQRSGYQSGGEIYLTKPFDNEELVSAITELITYG